jgi:hypothetical protein
MTGPPEHAPTARLYQRIDMPPESTVFLVLPNTFQPQSHFVAARPQRCKSESTQSAAFATGLHRAIAPPGKLTE